MKYYQHITLFGLVFCQCIVFSILDFASVEARTFDRIIAQVNNEIITEWELTTLVKQRSMELQRGFGVNEEESIRQAEQDRSKLLDQYIRQLLLVETALTLKDQIQVTDQEVDQRINTFKESAGIETESDFLEQLKREGFTFTAFREQTKRNLMAERLIMKRVLPKLQVRDQEIEDFFSENRGQFPNKTDEVYLKHIFIPYEPTTNDKKLTRQKVEDAITDLTLGDKFEDVAVQMSTKTSLDRQQTTGKMVEISLDEMKSLSTLFQESLADLSSGQISQPVESVDGFYVFRVEKKNDQKIFFQYFLTPFQISQTAKEKALHKSEQLVEKLDQGGDFDQVLQTHRKMTLGNDSKLKKNRVGGDLGFQPLANLSTEIRKAVESLEVGVYSGPVATVSGFHIFIVVDKQQSQLNEKEKEQVNLYLRDQKFQKEWKNYTNLLIEHSFVKYFDPKLIIEPIENEGATAVE